LIRLFIFFAERKERVPDWQDFSFSIS